MANKYVLLGGGVSAGYFAKAFVEQGFPRNSLTIVSSDSVLPYERPALSKGYLVDPETRYPKIATAVGEGGEAQTEEWYQHHGIEVFLNTLVLSIDFLNKTLKTTIGDIPFHKLILATGSDNVKPNWPGTDLAGVHVLRELPDADSLLASFDLAKQRSGRCVIVGGGYIGMETASGCIQNGIRTTMVFPTEYLMSSFLPRDLGMQYEALYVEKGVEFRKFTKVIGFRPNEAGDRVKYVCLEGGDEIECAFVIIGIGARPRTQLFKDFLDMDEETGGVLVDQYFQTSHPDVFAIGDIAAYPNRQYNDGKHTRVEHVDNARKSGQHLAHILHARATGQKTPEPYQYLPYFYSREFDKSWKFYGRQQGECYTAGSLFALDHGLAAVWVDDQGYVQGTFAESASKDDFELIKEAADQQIQVSIPEITAARNGNELLRLLRQAINEQGASKRQRPTFKQRIMDAGNAAYDMFTKVSEKMSTS